MTLPAGPAQAPREQVHGLPEPRPRKLQHQRRIEYAGFLRDDGLWDLEGELRDAKEAAWLSFGRGPMEPGAQVHCMRVRVTIDSEFRVVDAHAAMPVTPYDECLGARAPVGALAGASLGPGWRRAVEQTMGGVQGCTHLRELLYGLGTVAYQTLGPSLQAEAMAEGGPMPARHLGQCVAMKLSGPVVKRHYPGHYRPDRDEP